MAGNELHARLGELVRHGDGLLRVASVVAHFQLQLLAQDTAGGVDVRNRLLNALLHLLAEGGVLTGDRAGGRHRDVGLRHRGGHSGRRNRNEEGKLVVHSFVGSLL